MDAADFYTGLVAELYEPLRSGTPDADEYDALVRRYGEPALELGCGGGVPLVELRRRGLDVEGVDSSADMLERCRRRAADAGVEVTLHLQRMEDLDVSRTYPLIFLAGPTFNLLPDDDTALAALRAIRGHLEPGGAAVIPLFVPAATPPDEIGAVRASAIEGDATISVAIVAEEYDTDAAIRRTTLRYERRRAGAAPETLDRLWLLHWFSQKRFRELVAEAGLEVDVVLDDDGRPADADEPDPTFVLRAAEGVGP